MADSMRYADWFHKAKSELESAEILMAHGGDYAVIAFLCQQSIEKAYKGFILKRMDELIEGHSLVYLCKIAMKTDNSLKECMKDSAYVNQFYLETRYPSDTPMDISQLEAQECIDIANRILSRITENNKVG